MHAKPDELPPLENLLVAALYLSTHFARSGCPRMSHLLLHQLELAANHPRYDVSPMVQETCKKLYETWQHIHAERVSALAATEMPSAIRRVH
jgi:hypothetical protein